MSDFKELTDDELENVTGGISQNSDGTYNIQYGERFIRSSKRCTITGNYPNATLDTVIHYYWMDDGEKRDGTDSCPLSYLLLNSKF